MTTLNTLSEHACFEGVQGYYEHTSSTIGLPMRFGVYAPPQAKTQRVPALFYLAGLTCTEQTFAFKAGAQRIAAQLGLMLITPDTSPRSTSIAEADAYWDFGTAASFYLDAQLAPWSKHWRMESYVRDELRACITEHFSTDPEKTSIFGHSMGGHGALTLALRNPGIYRSVSAFSPICAPSQCPWGIKAFSGYLGNNQTLWQAHDANALIQAGARLPNLRIDQGMKDKFLAEQLYTNVFEKTCEEAQQKLTLCRHAEYDHGYEFIATFMEDHLKHHAQALAC